ncbi:prolipoprotein diacylglyceryl transferase [Paracoccaceae bacterium]|nr:prolipoprotein diacylglyceryl transferase [Paracoccaceae bacterium]
MFEYPNISETALSLNILGLSLNIQWYGLSYVFGIITAWFLMYNLVSRKALWFDNVALMEKKKVDDLITFMIIGIILGGRLGYCLFYTPMYYFANPIKILFIWEGGMSFHGGFIGVVLSGLYFGIKNGINIMSLGDLIAFASPPGLFFGRIANFINGELWGKPTSSIFGIEFTKGAGQFCPKQETIPCLRHPTQLYEALFEGIVLMSILFYLVYVRRVLMRPGFICGSFLLGYGIFRFLIEFLREPDSFFITKENPMGHVLEVLPGIGFSMGQLLTIPMIFLGCFLIIYVSYLKENEPRNQNKRSH